MWVKIWLGVLAIFAALSKEPQLAIVPVAIWVLADLWIHTDYERLYSEHELLKKRGQTR
jgi:hypothetical protein